jgi:hypothetical protein
MGGGDSAEFSMEIYYPEKTLTKILEFFHLAIEHISVLTA